MDVANYFEKQFVESQKTKETSVLLTIDKGAGGLFDFTVLLVGDDDVHVEEEKEHELDITISISKDTLEKYQKQIALAAWEIIQKTINEYRMLAEVNFEGPKEVVESLPCSEILSCQAIIKYKGNVWAFKYATFILKKIAINLKKQGYVLDILS